MTTFVVVLKNHIILRVLLNELPTSTIITVAHRLSNIIHFQRVLVIGTSSQVKKVLEEYLRIGSVLTVPRVQGGLVEQGTSHYSHIDKYT